MNNHKFLKQKTFESLEKFEKRLQETISQGWRVHGFTSDHRTIIVMLDRDR